MASFFSITRSIGRKWFAGLSNYPIVRLTGSCSFRTLAEPMFSSSTRQNPSSSPWLMLPPAFDVTVTGAASFSYKFYNPADNKIVSLDTGKSCRHERELTHLDMCFAGSSRGWLALLSPSFDLFLYNPISRRHIKLPPVRDLPEFPPGPPMIHKLILSCSPDTPNCRAIIIYNSMRALAFCCPGFSKEWTHVGDHHWLDPNLGWPFRKERSLEPGRQAHARMIASGFEPRVFVSNCLLRMYTRCSLLDTARKAFDKMSQGDVVHCVVVKWGFEDDVVTGSAVLDMYAKCKNLDESLRFFHTMPVRNWVSWSAIIAGCIQNDEHMSGLQLLKEMQKEGIGVSQSMSGLGFDEISLSGAFSACAVIRGRLEGTQLHGLAAKTPFLYSICVANAILDAYGKCGSLQEARQVFDEMEVRDALSWNSVIAACEQNKNDETLSQFVSMLRLRMEPDEFTFGSPWRAGSVEKLEGIVPNHATFVAVLRACGHIGLVDEALGCFNIMKNEHELEPQLKQLGPCGGCTKMIREMPLEADDVIWRMLFSTYVGLGVEDEESDEAWEGEEGSRVQLGRVVHMFLAGDKAHPRCREIYGRLIVDWRDEDGCLWRGFEDG
ncbi:Pentatricopeptide repeat-containing protein [Striga hermonthica]|uniref:Pentatricopeptide repeat-containing protein n=1 Tax=Striga hermonthica TaxID=68872 RepID=A0A9N7N1D0_STRHE|nr:Pentatricopeptide repeat-containing protein [Striga hermonthica]